MTKRVRITIEYDVEQTVEEERQDWVKGNVDFRDLWSLKNEHGEALDKGEDITIRFENV